MNGKVIRNWLDPYVKIRAATASANTQALNSVRCLSDNSINTKGLSASVLGQLETVSATGKLGAIAKAHVEKEVESPGIMAVGVDTDGESTILENILLAGVEDLQSIGSFITVVIKMTEVVANAGCNHAVTISEGDCDMSVAVLVLVVGVEANVRVAQLRLCFELVYLCI